ncbi:hypothetical protein OH76DRAFT_932221 [Lentinus brumalis]|uniref:Uncharacterized protein n=1 Tax=Lentinus brumalis TaxID=2498619 RepID=A0A371CZP9_9APHY|nr:hypothetical protein OH76DRAFT_932221 [Polyporus brumalis]
MQTNVSEFRSPYALLAHAHVPAPLTPSAFGPRPDTSFPVFDKTPGDDPFVRDDFIKALVSLARRELSPVAAQRYHAMILGMTLDNGSLDDAMVPQHESRRPTPPSSSGQGPAPPSTPAPVSTSQPLARQKAFLGAWDPDTFFHPIWWLYPRHESASSSGPALDAWMRSVRIVKRNYRANTRECVGVEASWRERFRSTFHGFDILQPGEDSSQSTRWPNANF